MNRRSFLSIHGLLRQDQIGKVEKITSGIAQYTGTWDTPQVKHLLKRTMFGATASDIAYFKAMTMSDAVDELLQVPANYPAPPLNHYSYVGSPISDPDAPYEQTWVNTPIINFNPLINAARAESFKNWWTGLLLNQNRSILEKMTMFWHNHFATSISTVGIAQGVYVHHNLLRQNALGNFKQFTKLISIDPAMLVYLNGSLNSASAPDENYARELQELFTVGKGPNSLYTEDDVKAAAKVLTGYRINYLVSPVVYYFDPNQHDTSNKTFSAFYSNTVIQGQSGGAGVNELDDLLDMIFATQEVAKHICRRLYTYFVYYKIDATTEANVIAPLANIFRNNNYEILPVLSALFKSEHFFDMMQIGCVIKNPLDFWVGLCREFMVTFPDNSDAYTQYSAWKTIFDNARTTNMGIGDPPVVAGWPAYYQLPMFHEIWLDSDTYPKRISGIDAFMDGFTANGVTFQIDPIALASTASDPSEPNILVAEMVGMLYGIDISQTSRDYFKTFLLGGQTQDHYWTDAWVDYINTPVNDPNYPMYLSIVTTRLKAMFREILVQSEYQIS